MAKVLRYVSAEARQLDMVFQFDVVDVGFGKTHKYETTPRNWKLPQLKQAIERTQTLIRGTDAWTTVFMENHDQARSVSRFTDDVPEWRQKGAKMLALMQSCLSGTQYIYQGQEIGAVNMPKDQYPVENYLDLDSYLFMDMVKERHGADNAEEIDKAFTALQHLARDHSRVPMPWDSALKYGGFSDVAEREGKEVKEPWMKPHPLVNEINVASQLDDPNSVLAFYRQARKLRRAYPDVLVYGDYNPLKTEDEELHFFVKHAVGTESRALVVLNFTKEDQTWQVPSAEEIGVEGDVTLTLLMSSYNDDGKSRVESLAPFEGRVYLINA